MNLFFLVYKYLYNISLILLLGPQRLKYLLFCPLQEDFVDPFSRGTFLEYGIEESPFKYMADVYRISIAPWGLNYSLRPGIFPHGLNMVSNVTTNMIKFVDKWIICKCKIVKPNFSKYLNDCKLTKFLEAV